MTTANDGVRALALCAAACGALTSCARDDGYRGGVYTAFTFQPSAASPSPVAWTSAMRRLLRYRSERDMRRANAGCSLPPPIVDPIA